MKGLQLEAIRVCYGVPDRVDQRPAVDGLSLRLAVGEIGCLLGPSGCGKTTVLRAIAGFEPLSAGRILLDGTVLSSDRSHCPPERRRVGMMFQEVALFPHLSAVDNIAFGLWREPRSVRADKTAQWLEWVGLPGLGRRFPHELSGGQQQRVALARALAPEPALLLLDEPFSSLDAATRRRLNTEVRGILKRAGQTALLVTHDEAEARSIGDVVGAMQDGRLVQWQPIAEAARCAVPA